MSLNAKNRSEKGFKMPKSLQICGWFLPKKIDLPTQGGVEVGILGGQKIKSPGNVMNCRINIFFFKPITPRGRVPGGGGGWGSKFQKSGKYH